MSGPRATALYARISEDRAGEMLGIKRQLEDCEKYANLKGWPVADRYFDDDISAYSGKPRPAYRRMLDDIASGQIDAVVVWHQDRLHRNPKELEEFLETCDRAHADSPGVGSGRNRPQHPRWAVSRQDHGRRGAQGKRRQEPSRHAQASRTRADRKAGWRAQTLRIHRRPAGHPRRSRASSARQLVGCLPAKH